MQDLNDLFREEEEKALAKTKKEMAEEQAAWDALPQSEKDRITAEYEAKYADVPEGDDSEEEDEDSEDEEDEEGEEE